MRPKNLLRSRLSARTLKLHLLLCTSLCAPVTFAQTVSTETTTPIETATANNGAPADITITEDGSIELSGTEGQIAVTMNSDNNITNDGLIQIEDTDNVTGIALEANRTGDLTMAGAINLVEDYDRTDDDEDEDLDGQLAIGANRIGIHLLGGGVHTGDINLQTGSSIAIEGNNSAGILLESALDGAFTLDGTLSVIGEDAVGIEIDNGVTDDVLISANVSAQGANARAISLDGQIGGNLTIESSVLATGFASTTVSNYVAPSELDDDTPALAERIDAEDLNDNGPALAIGGSLTNGFLINGTVDDFVSDEDTEDETKDTIEDFDENRGIGIITSTGSGPAVLITPDLDGDATDDIVLGTVIETVRDTTDDDEDEDLTEILATFDLDHGFINRGAISSNGLNVGYEATALRIEGAASGAFTTEIVGGILSTGVIDATAFEADATAVDLGDGAIIGSLTNTGRISAEAHTIGDDTAIAVQIDAGADLTSLNNSGTIRARIVGETGNAYGIRDLSGGLSTIRNSGTLSAIQIDNGVVSETTGAAVALDLSNSVGDITVLQERETATEDTNNDDVVDSGDVATPVLAGDILFGAGNDTFTVLAGSVVGDTDFGLGNAVMDLSSASYEGDITFSSGTNALSLTSSTLSGDVSFGGTGSTFDLTGSIFEGQIISSGALDSLTAVDSDLLLSTETAATLNSLSITGDSMLQVELDPGAPNSAASLTVTGTATIGDDVSIRPDLQAISSTDFRHTFIDAGLLSFDGELDAALVQDAPFIYNVDLILTDDNRDTLDLAFSLKTAEDLGLDLNQSAAYGAVLDVFSADSELGAALADITEEAEFLQVYDLLLPQRTDAATRYLSSQGSAVFGALGNRLKTLSGTGERNMGLWAQEYTTIIDIDADTNVPGYNGSGLGFAAGIDRRLGPIDVLGLFVNYSSGDFEEKTGGTNPVTTSGFGVGLYAKESIGWLDLAISSQVSTIDFNSRREVDLADANYVQTGQWGGTSAMTSASLSTEFTRNQFYARPQISVDFFQLDQEAYTETGDERLAVSVESAKTDQANATALMEFGARLPVGDRNPAFIIPEISIGYRSELSSSPYQTTARFLGSEETFEILAQDTFSDAILAGVSLSTESLMGTARFGYDIEVADEGLIHIGGATLKLKF